MLTEKGQANKGLSLILIILGVAVLIFAIAIVLYVFVSKQTTHNNFKNTHISQNTALPATFEGYLKDAPSQSVSMYQHIKDVFKDDLPILKPQDIRSSPTTTNLRISIPSEKLSKQHFRDEILTRFLDHQWTLENDTDLTVYLRHSDYGHCGIFYPKENHPEWMISCWKRHPSSFNKIPTKPI